MLSLTGDFGGQWKEYFKDLLKPTDVLSVEKAEAVDQEVDPFVTYVSEVPRKLISDKAVGSTET